MIYILDNIPLSILNSLYMFPTNPRNTLKCPQTIHICLDFFSLLCLEIVTAVYWTQSTQTDTGRVYSVEGWRRRRWLAAGDVNY